MPRSLRQEVSPTNPFVEFRSQETEQSVPDRFEQQVRRHAGRIALKTKRQALTYAALNQMANRLAWAIAGQLPDDERPVALLLENDAPLIAAILGVLKAGAFYVPLDPSYPLARLAFMLDDSRAELVITDSRNLALANELVGGRRALINVDRLDPGLSTDNLELPICPEAKAYLLYTSGSTGKPKGVLNNHRNLLHQVMTYTNSLHLCKDDRHSLLQSCGFSRTLKEVFAPLLNGAAVCMFDLRQEGLSRLADWLAEEEITILGSAVTTYRHFIHVLTGREMFPHLRLIYLGAEPLYRRDVASYKQHFSQDCILVHGIGTTETGTFLRFFIDRKTSLEKGPVPLGYPLPDMDVLLLDDAGAPVGLNRTGEITIRSRFLALGYWRRADLTQAVFGIDPEGGGQRIYRTGDLGRLRPDGCFEHAGRKDLQVKVRGHRVEPGEVEAALLEHGGVKEAVVVADEQALDGAGLVAYVSLAGERSPTARELWGFLRERLPEYLVPTSFLFLDSLPQTPSGKVDRRALSAAKAGQSAADHPGSAVGSGPRSSKEPLALPTGPTESALAELWVELLGSKQFGVHDSFFELGGHSLLVMRLFLRIEQVFGKSLAPALIFRFSTIEQLARLIQEGDQTSGWDSLVPIQPQGAEPPFFCVHGFGGGVLGYARLAHLLGPEQPFYGLQARGLDGDEAPHTRIKEMAAHYVTAVRSLQPSGPYYLGGYCYGGVVAFEMARQLQAVGERVGLLAVLEGYALRRSEIRRRLWSPKAMVRFVGNLPYWLRDTLRQPGTVGRIIARTQHRKRRFGPEDARDWHRNGAQARIKAVIGNVSDVREEHHKVMEAHLRAMRAYTPSVYRGRVTLFRVRGLSLARSYDPEMGWGRLAQEGVTVRMVSGAHYNILEEPHVRMLAAQLLDSLALARTRSTEGVERRVVDHL
jgi:amino acid adenylation domain-containing protein